jgi:hypothetical protein
MSTILCIVADTVNIKGKRGNIETLNPYFLGSIVLVKGDKSESEVIDAQHHKISYLQGTLVLTMISFLYFLSFNQNSIIFSKQVIALA